MLLIVLSWPGVEAPRPLKARTATTEELRGGGISQREQELRREALGRFERWVAVLSDLPLETMARSAPLNLSELLEEFLYQLFSTRWSHNEGRLAVLGLSDRFPRMRSQCAGPWRVLRNWSRLEPPIHCSPIPIQWFRAFIVTALA